MQAGVFEQKVGGLDAYTATGHIGRRSVIARKGKSRGCQPLNLCSETMPQTRYRPRIYRPILKTWSL